jgi:hypothetical protein
MTLPQRTRRRTRRRAGRRGRPGAKAGASARRAAAALARAVRERSLPRTCTRADGKPKRAFAHIADAQRAAATSGGRLEAYHCPNCGRWHLATRRSYVGDTVWRTCPRCGNDFTWVDSGKRGYGGVVLDDPGFCPDCWERAGA